MGDGAAGNRRVVRGFRQDEGALQHRLDMLGESDRGDVVGGAVQVDRGLDVGGERLAIGVDARLARGADAVAGRIGFLHHRADEAGIILGRTVEHRQPEIDMAEQTVERVVQPVVRRHLEHRPRALGPALGGGDPQRFLRREMVEEGTLGDPCRRTDFVDAGRGIALLAYRRVRCRDQRRTGAAARCTRRWGGAGRGLVARHANQHTDQLVWRQAPPKDPSILSPGHGGICRAGSGCDIPASPV